MVVGVDVGVAKHGEGREMYFNVHNTKKYMQEYLLVALSIVVELLLTFNPILIAAVLCYYTAICTSNSLVTLIVFTAELRKFVMPT